MNCAISFHFKMIECCCVATLPKSFVSPLSTKQFHFLPPVVSFKSKIVPFRALPFVAKASEEGEIGIGFKEANASDDSDTFTWVSNETNVDSAQLLEKSNDGDSYADPPEEAKLFVGNLAYDIDSEKLAQLFEKAGVVEISEVIYNRQTDQSRGFGFVTMSSVEEAENAVDMFNGFEVEGRQLTVNKAAPKGAQTERVPRTYEPAFRMYVGNLPWQVDNNRLEQVFSEHGKVIDARVVYDRESGRSRGFGFVTMSSEDELNDAIAALDGQNLDGRAIRVNVAEERSRRGF